MAANAAMAMKRFLKLYWECKKEKKHKKQRKGRK